MTKKTVGILSVMLVLSLLSAPDGWASSLQMAPEALNVSVSSDTTLSREASYEEEVGDLINAERAKRDLLFHGPNRKRRGVSKSRRKPGTETEDPKRGGKGLAGF